MGYKSGSNPGRNDLPPIGSITHNVRPVNYSGYGRAPTDRPLYPELNESDPKTALLHTYVPAFTVATSEKTPRSIQQIGQQFYDGDKDLVPVSTTLNGMFSHTDAKALERAESQIRFAGYSEYDIPKQPGRYNRGNQRGVTRISGLMTVLNTGTETIPANSLVMWTIPAVVGGRVQKGGANNVDKYPDNIAVLMTIPFRPDEHRANLKLLKNAYSSMSGTGAEIVRPTHTPAGWRVMQTQSKKFVRALVKVVYSALNLSTKGAAENPVEFEKTMFKELIENAGNIEDDLSMNDFENSDSFFADEAKSLQSVEKAAKIFKHQAVNELISSVQELNGFYTQRIIGRNQSGAVSPQNDFDILLRVPHTGSL